jgi:hypothetical protein
VSTWLVHSGTLRNTEIEVLLLINKHSSANIDEKHNITTLMNGFYICAQAIDSFPRKFSASMRNHGTCSAFIVQFSGIIICGIELPAEVTSNLQVVKWREHARPSPFPLITLGMQEGALNISLHSADSRPHLVPGQIHSHGLEVL